MSTTTLSFRIDRDLRGRLSELAEATDRSMNFHATQALKIYLKEQLWQIEHIQEGLDQAHRGDVFAHEDVDRWLASLGSEHEMSAPILCSVRP